VALAVEATIEELLPGRKPECRIQPHERELMEQQLMLTRKLQKKISGQRKTQLSESLPKNNT
jgi:hypothetical protein